MVRGRSRGCLLWWRTMKILHITPYFQPGMGYQENYLPAAQKQLGHEVMLLTSDRYPPHPSYRETMQWTEAARCAGCGPFLEDGVEVRRLRVRWEWRAHWWVYLSGLWEAIAAYGPDIIQTHCLNGALTYQVLVGNVRRRVPLVVYDDCNYFNKAPYTWVKWGFYQGLKFGAWPLLLRTVDLVLAMSDETCVYLHHDLGVPKGKIMMHPYGAEHTVFRRDEALARELRTRLGIPGHAVVIINAGKVTPCKDNHVLLEAFAKVRGHSDRAFLVMAGNAPRAYRDRLEKTVAKSGLAPYVRWVDFLPHSELPAYYSLAEIGVWPGDWSCTVLEAASCGVALIQPDQLYTRYSSANSNSLLFERGNADELAGRMLTLVRDEGLRRAMGERSRELIERSLNWENLAKTSIAIYKDVLNKRGAPVCETRDYAE